MEKGKSKKIEKEKIQKIEKEENPKKQKRKIQKIEKGKSKKKKNFLSVVVDKIYVFCLYPIPDSQQYVKRGSCRRLILSGLLCLFSFWASGPFVTSFECGPRTLSLSFIYLFCQVFKSFCISYLFRVYFIIICRQMSCLCLFRIMSCFSYLFTSIVLFYFDYVS